MSLFAIEITLIVVLLAVFLGLSGLVMSYRRTVNKMQTNTQKQLKMINSGVIAMGQRILELESDLTKIRQSQASLGEGQQDYSYSKARNLLENDLEEETIATACGLSVSEVQLMKLIYSAEKANSNNTNSVPAL